MSQWGRARPRQSPLSPARDDPPAYDPIPGTDPDIRRSPAPLRLLRRRGVQPPARPDLHLHRSRTDAGDDPARHAGAGFIRRGETDRIRGGSEIRMRRGLQVETRAGPARRGPASVGPHAGAHALDRELLPGRVGRGHPHHAARRARGGSTGGVSPDRPGRGKARNRRGVEKRVAASGGPFGQTQVYGETTAPNARIAFQHRHPQPVARSGRHRRHAPRRQKFSPVQTAKNRPRRAGHCGGRSRAPARPRPQAKGTVRAHSGTTPLAEGTGRSLSRLLADSRPTQKERPRHNLQRKAGTHRGRCFRPVNACTGPATGIHAGTKSRLRQTGAVSFKQPVRLLPAGRRHRERQNGSLHAVHRPCDPAGQVRHRPGAGNRPDTADGAPLPFALRRPGRHPAQRADPDRTVHGVAAHQERRGVDRRRRAFRRVRALRKPGRDHHRRGTRRLLQTGQRTALPRARRRHHPRPVEKCAGRPRLGHAVHGNAQQRPPGQIPPPEARPAHRRRVASRGPPGGHAPGTGQAQKLLHPLPAAPAVARRTPGARRTVLPVPQPARHGELHRLQVLRIRLRLPALQRLAHLSRHHEKTDVPLLQLCPAGTHGLPGLPRRGHPFLRIRHSKTGSGNTQTVSAGADRPARPRHGAQTQHV